MTEAINAESKNGFAMAEAGEAIQALTKLLGENLKSLDNTTKQHYVTAIGVTSMLACLPGVANLDPKHVGSVIGLLIKGQPDHDALRDRISGFIATVITIARDVKAATAKEEAAAGDAVTEKAA